MPKAIEVKYHPETKTKPGHYVASDSDGNRVKVSAHVDHSQRGGVAVVAALALCEKMKWTGRLIHGGFKDREYFVFDDAGSAVEAGTVGNHCPKCGRSSFNVAARPARRIDCIGCGWVGTFSDLNPAE